MIVPEQEMKTNLLQINITDFGIDNKMKIIQYQIQLSLRYHIKFLNYYPLLPFTWFADTSKTYWKNL